MKKVKTNATMNATNINPIPSKDRAYVKPLISHPRSADVEAASK
jgi:hypothetical protein